MLLDQINMNYLRIFEAVYRTRSMTQAASELHLTQSGISQHIKSLEDTLKVKLFDRIKQKLIPTEEGKRFYQQLSPHLQKLEEILVALTNKENALMGEVQIGIPVVFGLNVIIPHISRLGALHPQLRFRIFFDFATNFNQRLLKGEVDFAFVDEYTMDRQIETEYVYDETLMMCCSKDYIKSKGEGTSRKYFESLDYLDYDHDSPLASRWLGHHYKVNNPDLKIRAEVADALGIAKLITSNMGVGVLPGHQIEKLKIEGKEIYIFPAKNPKELKNKISVAFVKGRSWSPAVQESFHFLMKELKIKK